MLNSKIFKNKKFLAPSVWLLLILSIIGCVTYTNYNNAKSKILKYQNVLAATKIDVQNKDVLNTSKAKSEKSNLAAAVKSSPSIAVSTKTNNNTKKTATKKSSSKTTNNISDNAQSTKVIPKTTEPEPAYGKIVLSNPNFGEWSYDFVTITYTWLQSISNGSPDTNIEDGSWGAIYKLDMNASDPAIKNALIKYGASVFPAPSTKGKYFGEMSSSKVVWVYLNGGRN